MRPTYQTLAAGTGIGVLARLGSFSNGVPSLVCPMPAVTVLPAMFFPRFHLPYGLAVLVAPLLFFAWSPGLSRGNQRVPKRSWAAMVVLSFLTVVYPVGSWKYGIQYQGREYSIAVCAVNLVWLVLLWVVLCHSVRTSSFISKSRFTRPCLRGWHGTRFRISVSCPNIACWNTFTRTPPSTPAQSSLTHPRALSALRFL